jgi:hypothetical protein
VIVVLLVAGLAQECRSDLADVLERLGSDSVVEREDASAILRYVGEPALPDLERAAVSSDAEVSARARALILAIAPHRAEVAREAAHLFLHACGAFRAGRLESSLGYCEGLLRIDPAYGPALRLREAAARARREEGAREAFLTQVDGWREETREAQGRLPGLETLRYPSGEAWKGISAHLRHEAHLYAAVDSDDCVHIGRKLETMKIDLAFENTKLEDILSFIRDFSGINLLLDAEVRDRVDPDQTLTFKTKDLTLKGVLKLLLARFDLDYVITEERVLLLTDPKRICDLDDF